MKVKQTKSWGNSDSEKDFSVDMPKAHVRSLGCISNLMDGTWYERLIREAGFQLTPEIS